MTSQTGLYASRYALTVNIQPLDQVNIALHRSDVKQCFLLVYDWVWSKVFTSDFDLSTRRVHAVFPDALLHRSFIVGTCCCENRGS